MFTGLLLVDNVNGRTQAEGALEQGAEGSIWAGKGWSDGAVEKTA
jgi:hypothetical protein